MSLTNYLTSDLALPCAMRLPKLRHPEFQSSSPREATADAWEARLGRQRRAQRGRLLNILQWHPEGPAFFGCSTTSRHSHVKSSKSNARSQRIHKDVACASCGACHLLPCRSWKTNLSPCFAQVKTSSWQSRSLSRRASPRRQGKLGRPSCNSRMGIKSC